MRWPCYWRNCWDRLIQWQQLYTQPVQCKFLDKKLMTVPDSPCPHLGKSHLCRQDIVPAGRGESWEYRGSLSLWLKKTAGRLIFCTLYLLLGESPQQVTGGREGGSSSQAVVGLYSWRDAPPTLLPQICYNPLVISQLLWISRNTFPRYQILFPLDSQLAFSHYIL